MLRDYKHFPESFVVHSSCPQTPDASFFLHEFSFRGRVCVRGRISLFPQRHRGEPRSNFYSLYTNTCQEANLETVEPSPFLSVILAPTTFSSSFFFCWFCCLKLQPPFTEKGVGESKQDKKALVQNVFSFPHLP